MPKFKTVKSTVFTPYGKKRASTPSPPPITLHPIPVSSQKKRDISSAKEMEQTIIFTIARMNPPTIGHIELIKTLIVSAIEQGNM